MTTDQGWRPTCRPRAQFLEGSDVDVPDERRLVNGILVLYFDAGTPWAANQLEHAKSIGRHSRFRVWNLNTFYPFPPRLARFDFSVIALHYSLFGAIPGPHDPILGTPRYLLNEDHLAFLRTSRGHKLAIFQDEQTYCRARFNFCDDFEIDTVYTCLEPSEYERTWRRYTRVPNVHTTLPGYVDDGLGWAGRRHSLPDPDRDLDVGYRGRTIPLFMEPRQEKTEIGRGFAELAAGSGLALDIGLDEEDRLYGRDWQRFLGRCRCVLGVESGAAVVDCEDEVRNDYERILVEKGAVTAADIAGTLGRWEGAIRYRTISPRHFEAAAFGSCQVLFEGEYSGAMRPMEHYVPLRKDFSNFDEVLERIRDRELRRELSANARRDLIDSGAYGYERFVSGLDRDLIDAGLDPEPEPRVARAVQRAWAYGTLRRALEYRVKRRINPIYARVRGIE